MADVEVGSKRSTEHDEYVPQKRQRGEGPLIRLLVNGKSCGAVIGKAGENIKRLRKENGVKIKVEDARPNGCITLIGDRSPCVNVFKEILPVLTCPQSVNARDRLKSEINLLVQTDQVGAVIGKAGQKIKDIQEESGAKVKVCPDCLPNSNERIVAVGSSDSGCVTTALEVILSTLDERPFKKQIIYFDPKNTNINDDGMQNNNQQPQLGGNNLDAQAGIAQGQLVALNALGLGGLAGLGGLGGLGGGTGILNQLGGGLGGMGQMGGAGILGGGNDMAGSGGGGGVNTGYHNDNRDVRNDNRDRGGARGGNNERREEFADMVTETKITVPNDMCGVIIGKGGENVREIRKVSGASIDFTQNERGSREPRDVILKGTQKQLIIAQQVMAEFIHNRVR